MTFGCFLLSFFVVFSFPLAGAQGDEFHDRHELGAGVESTLSVQAALHSEGPLGFEELAELVQRLLDEMGASHVYTPKVPGDMPRGLQLFIGTSGYILNPGYARALSVYKRDIDLREDPFHSLPFSLAFDGEKKEFTLYPASFFLGQTTPSEAKLLAMGPFPIRLLKTSSTDSFSFLRSGVRDGFLGVLWVRLLARHLKHSARLIEWNQARRSFDQELSSGGDVDRDVVENLARLTDDLKVLENENIRDLETLLKYPATRKMALQMAAYLLPRSLFNSLEEIRFILARISLSVTPRVGVNFVRRFLMSAAQMRYQDHGAPGSESSFLFSPALLALLENFGELLDAHPRVVAPHVDMFLNHFQRSIPAYLSYEASLLEPPNPDALELHGVMTSLDLPGSPDLYLGRSHGYGSDQERKIIDRYNRWRSYLLTRWSHPSRGTRASSAASSASAGGLLTNLLLSVGSPLIQEQFSCDDSLAKVADLTH